MDPVNVPAKFAVRSFTRSLDNRVPQKFGQSLDTPMLSFNHKFSWVFVRMDPVNIAAKLEVCSVTHS